MMGWKLKNIDNLFYVDLFRRLNKYKTYPINVLKKEQIVTVLKYAKPSIPVSSLIIESCNNFGNESFSFLL